jgi:hypothetical protein
MRLDNGIKYNGFDTSDREGVIAFRKPFGIALIVEN